MLFNLELVETLLKHGAKLTATDPEKQKNCFLLHFAIDEHLIDIVRLFLNQNQIPIDTLNEHGWSPLHLAVAHNNIDLVRLLIKHGAQVNIEVRLHKKKNPFSTILIFYFSALSFQDHRGNTPLAWAQQMKHIDLIEELERQDARANDIWNGEPISFVKFDVEVQREQFETDHSNSNNTFVIGDALQNFKRISVPSQLGL